MPAAGAASPYPSTIEVGRLPGRAVGVQVALAGITHPRSDQLDVMLAGPGGRVSMVMSDACGDENMTDKLFFFAQISPGPLEEGACVVGHGYRPTDVEPGTDLFPAPAPAGPYPSDLSVFDGIRPEGEWRLFVVDDEAPDGGSIAPAWLLRIGLRPDRCGGRAATVIGTVGPDRLRGTAGPDVIAALGGDDVVRGLRGADLLCGGRGRDRLIGGPGRDRCRGGPGRDRPFSC